MFCYHCQNPVEGKVSFREECSQCRHDLHICLNCRFYDPSAYNECKESSAERVRDKERNNLCEYFDFSSKKPQGQNLKPSQTREALLKSAEALFKKPEK